MKQYTFFIIQPPKIKSFKSGLEWAAKHYNHYGFDYNIDLSNVSVFAWSDSEDSKLLASKLEADNIKYTTFTVDNLDKFFGVNWETL